MPEQDTPATDPRLLESEQRYRAVIQNASDMIQSVRPDGTFEFVNASWLRTMGYSEDEVSRLIVWDIIHPDALEHCQPIFAKAVAGETIDYMESTFLTKDGQAIPVEGNVTSRFIGDRVVATHGFFRDIRERLRAQELEARNRELEREQRARYLEKMAALGKLSAGLAHELNNPAAAIQRADAGLAASLERRERAMHALIEAGLDGGQWRAIASLVDLEDVSPAGDGGLDPLQASEQEALVEEWLEDRGIERAWDIAPGLVRAGITGEQLGRLADDLPPGTIGSAVAWLTETLTIRESTGIIGRSSRRISELVDAVKGYSHMDRATVHEADVHDGLENTLIILGHRLRNVAVERDYDRTLPAIQVFGNSLNQVWTNLLDNAIDAMDDRGRVRIRTRRDDGHVVVEIEDNGSGIAPEDLACIFEPFFTTKPQGQGTGLGLDTAWRIVTEEHGGTIAAESRTGCTVFRVAIPIVANATAGGPVTPS